MTVLDVVNVRLDREMPVGPNPVAVAASPTRNEVYVVNCGQTAGQAQGSISVIDCENNAVVATIPRAPRSRFRSMWTPTGKLAYVANRGSNSISVVDLEGRREVAQIGVGEEPVAARALARRQDAGGGQLGRGFGDA